MKQAILIAIFMLLLITYTATTTRCKHEKNTPFDRLMRSIDEQLRAADEAVNESIALRAIEDSRTANE